MFSKKVFQERDVGGYLRCLIDYGAVTQGLKVAANCVEEETKKVSNAYLVTGVPFLCLFFLLLFKAPKVVISNFFFVFFFRVMFVSSGQIHRFKSLATSNCN